MAIIKNNKVQGTGKNQSMLYSGADLYVPDAIKGTKAKKQQAKDDIVVTANTVMYDGDIVSINYMSSVVAVANFKYNQYTSIGVALDPLTPAVLTILTPDQAYTAVFKSTITWKGADNLNHTVQIESVAEALELAMTATATVIGV